MSNKPPATTQQPDGKPALTPKLRFPEFRDAVGWEEKTLGNEGDFFSSLTGKAGADFDAGKARFVTYMNVFSNTFTDPKALRFVDVKEGENQNTVLCGDVFFTISSETPEEVGMSSVLLEDLENCYLNSFCALFRFSEKKRPNPVFVGYLLRQPLVRAYFTKKAQGSTRFNLSKDAFRSLPLCLPKPSEQQKIAECLSSVDELIAAQARKLDALKTHKKGLMQQLFPREDETQPRLRFPEFQNAGEWVEDKLIDIATFRRGSFPQPYGLPEWYDEVGGMPFVQVFDVGDNFRLKDKTKSKISKLGAEKSVFIPKGTLIVTLQGSIGRVAITHYDAYIDRTLLIFETFLKPIEKVFFARLIQNLFDIEKEIAPGGIIKTITKEALSDFKVKLPTIEEQQRIADCLTSLDDLIAAQTQTLEALKTHKQGLMQQLFPFPEEVEA